LRFVIPVKRTPSLRASSHSCLTSLGMRDIKEYRTYRNIPLQKCHRYRYCNNTGIPRYINVLQNSTNSKKSLITSEGFNFIITICSFYSFDNTVCFFNKTLQPFYFILFSRAVEMGFDTQVFLQKPNNLKSQYLRFLVFLEKKSLKSRLVGWLELSSNQPLDSKSQQKIIAF